MARTYRRNDWPCPQGCGLLARLPAFAPGQLAGSVDGDVVVEPEQVLGIVAPLQLGEPRQPGWSVGTSSASSALVCTAQPAAVAEGRHSAGDPLYGCGRCRAYDGAQAFERGRDVRR